jgi:hypothetical protein
MTVAIFWDIAACTFRRNVSPASLGSKINRATKLRVSGASPLRHLLHVSEECITSIFRFENQLSNKPACSTCLATLTPATRWFVGRFSTLKMEVIIPPEHRFTYRLHAAIFQNMTTFITTAVITSNPTDTMYLIRVIRFYLVIKL